MNRSSWSHTRLPSGILRSRFVEPLTRHGRRSGGAGTTITIERLLDRAGIDAKAIRQHDGKVVTFAGTGSPAQVDDAAVRFQMFAHDWCSDDGTGSNEWIDPTWTSASER
jgi:hypothetical protein